MRNDLHGIRYSERMWVLSGPYENPYSGLVPMIYKSRATAWFTREDLGRDFIRGSSSWSASGAFLVEVRGLKALHRVASELHALGIDEIYFDLSRDRTRLADRLEGFLRELEGRLSGKGEPTAN